MKIEVTTAELAMITEALADHERAHTKRVYANVEVIEHCRKNGTPANVNLEAAEKLNAYNMRYSSKLEAFRNRLRHV